MNRYLNEMGVWVKATPKQIKKVREHSNKVAQKHNEKAIENNASATPFEEQETQEVPVESEPEKKAIFGGKKKKKKNS